MGDGGHNLPVPYLLICPICGVSHAALRLRPCNFDYSSPNVEVMNTTTQVRKARTGWTGKAAMAITIPVLSATAVITPAMLSTSSAQAVDSGPGTSTSTEVSPTDVTLANRVSHFSGGGVTVRGNKWMGGNGVNVYRGRQCTELASRLYAKKGWGTLNNIYKMRSNRSYGKLKFHRNGSGYKPVPGDVVVELGGSYQHVAVVHKVKKKKIKTMEQNAVPNGRHTYKWKKGKAYGAYGPRHVGGFIHSSKNRAR